TPDNGKGRTTIPIGSIVPSAKPLVVVKSGGGGNRTRVRGRTDRTSTSLGCPLLSPGRPGGSRPTAGPALLWSRAPGDWLSFGARRFVDGATGATGRARSDASPNG